MRRTRGSLYFAAGYLYFGGAGFLLVPSVMLDILFAEGIYSHTTLRLAGALMLSLAILLTGIIENSLEVFYTRVIAAETPAIACLAYLYWNSLDRMWLIAFLVTFAGWLYSLLTLFLDRRHVHS